MKQKLQNTLMTLIVFDIIMATVNLSANCRDIKSQDALMALIVFGVIAAAVSLSAN